MIDNVQEDVQIKKRGRPAKNNNVQSSTTTTTTEISSVINVVKDKENIYEQNSFYNSESYKDIFGIDIFGYYSQEDISEMIARPMTNNELLRRLSMKLYSSNGLFTKTVDYCTSLPTLDYVIIPKCKSKDKKKVYHNLMDSALKNLHHKEIIRDALFKSMIEGVAFYYAVISQKNDKVKYLSDYDVENIIEINDIGTNISLIPLPTNYTKIVGRKNSSYILAFNVDYFRQYSGDELNRKLKMYPSEITNRYNTYIKNCDGKNWMILDNNKTVVSKIRSKLEEPWGRPMCLGAIKDILYSSYYSDTKRSQLDEINNRIFYQTFPQGKEVGTCSLTKNQQQEQHDKVKSAIMTKNKKNSTSFFSVASGTKIDQIKVDTSIFDSKNEANLNDNIGLDLGFMASLLTGSNSGNYSSQSNNLQLLMSEIFSWIEPIALEFSKVINQNIIKDLNNKVEVYYLPCSIITRQNFTSQMKDLYLQGKGSLVAWIASTGFNSDAYLTLMDMELEENFDEKYKAHQTSYTLSDKNSNKTKNTKENTELTNDNTIKSKTYDTNKIPKPSDK